MDHISICRFFSVPKTKKSGKPLDNPPVLSGAGSFFIPFGSNLPNNDDINFHRGYGIWGAIDRLGIPRFLQKDAYTSIGFLIAHGEVLPREKNSVSLSGKTDEWGIPIPYIEFEWSENELNMAKHMEKTIQKSVKAANGKIKNIDELPENNLEKNSYFEESNDVFEEFEFNQDLELDNDSKRSPGWIRYQKRIK